MLVPVLGYRVPFSLYFPAAVVAAWFGGLGPGLMAVALGTLAADFFFFPPVGTLSLEHPGDWSVLVVFLVTATAVVVAIDGMRRARSRETRASGEARFAHETLERAVEAGRMGYWTWEVETGEMTWSENFEPLHGLGKGEFAGTFDALLELIHPEDRLRVEAAIRGALRTGTDYDIEFRVPRKDGSVRWMNGRGHVELESGRPVRIIGLRTDVTERQRAEATRQRLAAIVDSSEDAIVAIDLSGRILTWNAAARRMFGWSADEAIGESVEILLPVERPDDFFAEIERVRRGEHIAHYETVRRRKDGRVLEVALSVSPIRDESGRIVGASKILRDMTAINAERRERERTRELFLASLGHDLRNPLNTITASAYLLERRTPAKDRGAVHRIESSAHRMARMIEQLLDFTRARLGGGIPLRPKPADLTRICGSVIEEVEAQYPDRVRLVTSGDLAGVWDEDRIAQVVSNLIGNALDHGDQEKPIFVYLKPTDGHVEIEVVNSGPPIPPELLPRIFDPFRRGSQERYGPQKGLGLGLFIAREIVEKHGGHLEARSNGKETSFRVTLPWKPDTIQPAAS
jgi:PAS domain S-box-containing protein